MSTPSPIRPPRLADRLFTWYCEQAAVEDLQGDIEELFYKNLKVMSARRAKVVYWRQVLALLFSYALKKRKEKSAWSEHAYPFIHPAMIKNFFKIAFRNLIHNKGYAFINVAGLMVGMTVSILTGLWIADEVSFDRYHPHYDRIGQIWTNASVNGSVESNPHAPWVMAEEIRNSYGSDFRYVVQSTWTETHTLSLGDLKYYRRGNFMEPEIAEMLSLKMIRGDRNGLKEPHSVLLSETTAKIYFGDADPINQLIKLDRNEVKVTGVYEDLPFNTTFHDMTFIAPFELWVIRNPFLKEMDDPWSGNFTQVFVQLVDHASFEQVSAKIKEIRKGKMKAAADINQKPAVFVHPMSRWHLHSKFVDGKEAGGRIELIWLFGMIGLFVLILACINFMNLSTAQSEKRSKEVGIRKSVGSVRTQLVMQFFSESILLAFVSFLLSVLLTQLLLPSFNLLADKHLVVGWNNPVFWMLSLAFVVITGFLAGSYPALYLSSMQPVKVLKGVRMTGAMASLSRKVLVVIQFTVSASLIICTLMVYRQIDYAQHRPVGYDRSGLISMLLTRELHQNFDVMRNELKTSGVIVEMAESGSPPTDVWNSNSDFDWKGKNPGQSVEFPNNDVTYDYGKTVGWRFIKGRDFSKEFISDSSAFILNETAVKFMGLTDPIGEVIRWNGKPFTVIGVIQDMLVESPYDPVSPMLFHMTSADGGNVMVLRLNPAIEIQQALSAIEKASRKYSPSTPFDFKFVDDAYNEKFTSEARIGRLSGLFSILAIFISCLGIFALSSFMAERRRKEIGIRKVMGASVLTVWKMLSKEFVVLVLISVVITVPVSWYAMNGWLQKFSYHTDQAWWIFLAAGLGALLITLITVSYQSVKAAVANPVNSLRSE